MALVVFDARSETDPFAGVRHWDRALRQAQRMQGEFAPPIRKFLVAARTDRGGIGVSLDRIELLKRGLGFDGYFETSAKERRNISDLAEAIRKAIPWKALPKVSSTRLFQNIKGFLIKEKKAGRLLSRAEDLYRAFRKSKRSTAAAEDLRAQFDTCIGLVESRGLIRPLTFGDLVLLQPELLDAYASAMIDAAKEEPDGMGSLAEEDALEGRFRIPEDVRIKKTDEEKLLLIATVEEMLRHEIAFREPAEGGPRLVFPSQFTRENPELPDPEGKGIIFCFEGPVLNVYATLAVRLSHSGVFKKKEMWRNAATYDARIGGTCGMFVREIEEGRGELTLFFDTAASEETRSQFGDYVHIHLHRRALTETIYRRRIFVCPYCATPVSDISARRRKERGFDSIVCNVCETKISLLDCEERLETIRASTLKDMDLAADAGREFDAWVLSVAAETRTQSFKAWPGATKTTLALVLTDVVGSTALGNELGDERMNEVRRSHFQQARQLIEKHGGHFKAMGDGFMVAFHTAVEALNFALALHANPGHERLKIRGGIHVGPVRIEQKDAFGGMVNYVARVESCAKGVELWMSNRAKEDIDQEKAKIHQDLQWTRHSDCELKGFPGKHILWSANWPERELAAAVPPEGESTTFILEKKGTTGNFDVFLCHNSADKTAVKKIGKRLKERGVVPWLDEWELRPGLPWQEALEQQISQIKAAAVFVGAEGIGPWQRQELSTFLREFIARGCPVIPVLLPDAPKEPTLPFFLKNMTWVDFRKEEPSPMERLIWGITGERDI